MRPAVTPMTPKTTVTVRADKVGNEAVTPKTALYRLSALSTQEPAMMIMKAPSPKPRVSIMLMMSSVPRTIAALAAIHITKGCAIM